MRFLFVFLLVGLIFSCGRGDASGDASGDAENDKKTETAKQPNCKDVEGIEYPLNEFLIPEGYTGVVYECLEGKVTKLIHCKNGEQHGLKTAWYPTGELWGISNYKEGWIDGLSRDWYRNGQLYEETLYKDAKIISQKCWDEEGNEIECW